MDQLQPTRTTLIALALEGGLGAAALVVGWLMNHWPAVGMSLNSESLDEQLAAAGWGLIATLPLMAMLLVLDRLPWKPLADLRELAQDLIGRMFRGASLLQLAAVSLAAGLGEELLFRGLLQAGLAGWIGGSYGPWIALGVAAAVFGVCHWLSTTYAILAMLAGVYFGLLLILSGSLWTPIVTHAAYDFLALVYLLRPHRLIRSTG